MYEIDKSRFGAFVAQLRKEKGYTQRELAEKLFISDKAVSKWETGSSIPDTSMLMPLAELLGVTVTELLMCRPMEEASLEPGQVEDIVKTAVSLPDERTERAYQNISLWWLAYICAFILGGVETWYCYSHDIMGSTMPAILLLTAIFGAYFCFLVKTKLPQFYDDNAFGLYYDKGMRMNIPGGNFNNRNWPHVVRVLRIWACATMALYPAVNIVMNCTVPELWHSVELYAGLAFVLGGMFLPVYIVGKKYE